MAFDRSTEPAQAIEGRPIDPNPNETVGAGAIRASLRMNKARRPGGDKFIADSGGNIEEFGEHAAVARSVAAGQGWQPLGRARGVDPVWWTPLKFDF